MSTSIEYASFLVRVWREVTPSLQREGEGGEVSNWHGEVEHIQSGRLWIFDNLDELLAFLRKRAERNSVQDSAAAQSSEAARSTP